MNLPLDEYGAVDFDYIQNLVGNFFQFVLSFFDYFLCNPWLTRRMFFFLLIEQDVEVPVEVHHRRKDMTEEVTRQVYQALLARSKNETLGKKDTRIVADQFGVHIRSVQRL